MTTPHTHRRSWPGRTAVALLATGLTLTACGSSATTSTTRPASNTATNALTVIATDHGYSISGGLRPGTATITFTNQGSVSHSMNTVRLKPGVTMAQVLAALSKGGDPDTAAAGLLATPPGPASDYGTPGMAGPGQSITATMVGLPAGNYVVADFLVGPGGLPYFAQGLIDQFQVEGSPVTGTPAVRGTIGLGDTATAFPTSFDGTGIYRVTNTGTHENSIAFVRLDAGTSLLNYVRYVSQRLNRQPIDGGGGTVAGTITDLRPGQSVYLSFRLPPGAYGYVEPPHGQPSGPLPSGTFSVS
jgi:hypothetical protein